MIQVCQVTHIEYFCVAGSKDPFVLSAWARMRLARYASRPAGSLEGTLKLYRSLEPRAVLSRILGRVVLKTMELKEAAQFSEPVSKKDYPDYYDVRKAAASSPGLSV